ncbi:hypothetical protein DFQ27_004186 [Actinomortierella ambigua]|uniref:Uncharacterized protein n=1 Tax=Actinomortierella ambigua TaxID=1343610 RepID=A0A9P6Q4J5_9FUNG|nr:hypothetical protein DFQ27_004186 [Actinomortierella ambigua]
MAFLILSQVDFSGLESYDPLKALATLGPVLDPAAKTVEPLSDQVVTIDLTSDDDEENSKDIGVHKSVPAAEATLSPPRLLVDTQLLGNEWKLQIKSTYEFTGEARWEATQHQQQRPSWRLQARMVRNMDGVDLYTYIHSVRLMRQFVGSNI